MKDHTTNRKYATTDLMRHLLARSEEVKLTRLPTDEFWEAVDPDGKHVFDPIPPYESRSVRTIAFCKMRDTMEPATLFLDFCAEDWELLPYLPTPTISSEKP